MKEKYLGDGLYASFDGWQFCLRAPRENGDHFVALEPKVLTSFLTFVTETQDNIKQKIEAEQI